MGSIEKLILTPSARLARTLQLADAKAQIANGVGAWERPAVFPLSVWLRTLQTNAFIARDHIPMPLGAAEARWLWQSIIEQEVYAGQRGLAKLAESAWLKIHEHNISRPSQWHASGLNEDQLAFQRWARGYERKCKEANSMDFGVFLAHLPDWARQGLMELPAAITLHGFNIEPPPAYQQIFQAFEEAGVQIDRASPRQTVQKKTFPTHAFASEDDEILNACKWARTHLAKNPNHRIAIVVPKLDQMLESVEKHAKAVLDPPAFCLDAPAVPMWHISLGHPLAKTPMVEHALHVLGLHPHRIGQPDVAKLLRAPWIRGWEEEHAKRHRLILWLNDKEPYWLDFGAVIRWGKKLGCHGFIRQLSRWHGIRIGSPTKESTDGWAEQFQQELSAVGFGFGRTLDSVEYQTLQHWHRVLEQFGDLQAMAWTTQATSTRGAALAQLTTLSQEMLFREQDPGAPIAILGVQEALGAEFDAVWFTGMDQETWPSSPRRDPLIPGALQDNILTATPEGCLALAKDQLGALMAIAPDITISYSVGDEALPLEATRLLHAWGELQLQADGQSSAAISMPPAELETIVNDSLAPPLQETHTRGGVHLLNAQSACPFKAFGQYRLKLRDYREPRPGIGAKERGTLIHDILESFWKKTKDAQGLAAMDEPALLQFMEEMVETRLGEFLSKHPKALDATGKQLEAQNLIQKLIQWIHVERERGPFVTEHLEQSIELCIGPLTLEGKPDRIDKLENGDRLVIDYKTGKTQRSDWNPSGRLRDGQLPAYALTLEPLPKAIAFARIGKDGARFDGFCCDDVGINNIVPIEKYKKSPFQSIEDWSSLLQTWQQQLVDLAEAYQQGHATVDPVKSSVCSYCHLQSLCRIKERQAWIETDEEAVVDDRGTEHD